MVTVTTSAPLSLGFGLRFEDLYSHSGLAALDAAYVAHLKSVELDLFNQLMSARANPDALEDKAESTLLIALAPTVEDFLGQLFKIEAEIAALRSRHGELAPLYAVKRLFVQRRAAKAFNPTTVAEIDLEQTEVFLALAMGPEFRDELIFARHVADWLKDEEANQAAIDGTNALMSAEDKYYANKRNNEKKAKETVEQAQTQRENTTAQFLETKAGEKIVVREMMARSSSTGETSTSLRDLARDPKVQAEVQALIAEQMKKNPTAGAPAGQDKTTAFKGPEGFSNVIGVGANPVMEAMNLQLEESQKQTALLEKIASPEGGVPKDFTKETK